MNQISPSRLATAFLRADTPMLSEVMHKIEQDTELSRERRRDILSAMRRLAKALDLRPEDIPADARWLQTRLEKIAPASIGLTPKSWSNLLSDVRAGLVRYGVVERRIGRKADLSPEWSRVWGIVLKSGDKTLPLSLPRLVYFLNRLGVFPSDVSEAEMIAYRDALEQNELSKSPDQAYRAVVNSWNLAVKRIPEWPRQTFTLPSRSRTIKLDEDCFPHSFHMDLDNYLCSLENPDFLDVEAVAEPLRPASIAQYRAMILRFASVLVHAGIPVADITNLAALVDIRRTEIGLRWMLSKTENNRPTPGISHIINVLKNLAKRHVRVDEASQKKLAQWDARRGPKSHIGLTDKNRERLRPLKDKDTLRRLLLLPQQLFAKASKETDLVRAAIVQEDAIAMAILLVCPIRSKNLTSIHLETHLKRQRNGRDHLVFKRNEVKNTIDIEIELPRHVSAMIDEHVAARSPRLCLQGTPWLFPRRDSSGPTVPAYLSTRVKSRILRETGLVVNMHLFRHLACMIWLKKNPGQYEVARRLLGHSSVSQTMDAYADFETDSATQMYAELVDAVRRT